MSILLWLTGSLMALLAIGMLLPPLLRTTKSAQIERTEINVAIARERESELRKELDEGILSDAEFDAARGELEQGLAIDLEGEHDRPSFQSTSPLLAAGISAFIPMLALGVYLFLGTPDAYDQLDAAGSATHAGQDQPADVDTMLAQLKARLVDEPNDVRGWTLLGNAYMSIGQYADAVPAYRRLVALEPGNAERLVRLADALAMSRNGILAGEPETLIGQALALSPSHPQALWLAGIAAEERGNPAQALDFLERLLPLVNDQPEVLNEVQALVARNRAALDGESPAVADSITVTVGIASTLETSVAPSDTLFVYARVPGGPPMPVAVKKLPAPPIPREIVLSNQDLMLEGAGLESYPSLEVGAHVSRSGTVRKMPGDLVGLSQPFDPKQIKTVGVLIDQAVGE